jgi:pimeloyl-ACP methyl ester carboxylesterase
MLYAAIAGSRLIVYPKTGHVPQEEVADESAADVRAFLN